MTVEQILASANRLPTISRVAIQLTKLIRDPDASASDFESVIRGDPALGAELLRLANSALFQLPREVKSIRQAVALIGTRRLLDMATTAAMSSTITGPLPGYDVPAADFFCHCAAVAVIGERLAHELKMAVPDLVFVAGLLHDIGKLAVGQFVGQDQQAIFQRLKSPDEDLIHAERTVLGIDHAQVGAALAHRWDLPAEVERAAAHHHDPDSIAGGDPIVDLVHAADVLAHMLGYGADIGGLARRLAPNAVHRLGVKVQRIEAVAAATADDIAELTRIYGTHSARAT